jgi:hypothetical protein
VVVVVVVEVVVVGVGVGVGVVVWSLFYALKHRSLMTPLVDVI